MSASSVKSAERALDVLRLLASRVRPVPTMTISGQVGIPKSSTYHLLNVMRDRGWVIYFAEDRSWGLSSAALDVASGYLRSAPLQHLGRPLLMRLAEETGCAAHLALLHGPEALYLDKEQPEQPRLRLVTRAGIRLPAHLTAVGLAMLYALEDAQVGALYGRRPLSTLNGSGPRELRDLKRELAASRDRGFSYERGRVTRGISCLAVPVLNPEGVPVASVGVTWAEDQMPDADVFTFARHVKGASTDLELRLNPSRDAPELSARAVA